jgi:CDP-paratose 2-epimerase
LDNLSRRGSELNLHQLHDLNIQFIRGDIRCSSDLDNLPSVDWIIDCAANPSVLAGIDNSTLSRQVMEHNLLGTINLLEYCKQKGSGLILLSTSRVYSATQLAKLTVNEKDDRFLLNDSIKSIGVSAKGINEAFPTTPPLSLYGSSKLASEIIILEYANSFNFPVWINRCGVLAGAGQFGKADQGIFSFWIHSFREQRKLKYIGFDGSGLQVRDALHPKDLTSLLWKQMNNPNSETPKTLNLGGGNENAMSLRQLSAWCEERFGSNEILCTTEERPADAPWIVMDCSLAKEAWNWEPTTTTNEILNEIAMHAEKNPDWLHVCQ